jgi:hypothetical protein
MMARLHSDADWPLAEAKPGRGGSADYAERKRAEQRAKLDAERDALVAAFGDALQASVRRLLLEADTEGEDDGGGGGGRASPPQQPPPSLLKASQKPPPKQQTPTESPTGSPKAIIRMSIAYMSLY